MLRHFTTLLVSSFWASTAQADAPMDGNTSADAAHNADAIIVGMVDTVERQGHQQTAWVSVDDTLFGDTPNPLMITVDKREPGQAHLIADTEVVLFVTKTDDGEHVVSKGEAGQIRFQRDEAQTILSLAEDYAQMRTTGLSDAGWRSHHHALVDVIEMEMSDRRMLASALSEIENGFDGLDPFWLMDLADDSNALPIVRIWATRQLAHAPEQTAAPLLGDLTLDEDAAVRVAALESLAQLDAPEGLEAALNALRDPQASVRQAAAHSLGLLGDESHAEVLIAKIAQEKNLSTQVEMVTALSEIASPVMLDRAIDVLEAAPMRPLVRQFLRARL